MTTESLPQEQTSVQQSAIPNYLIWSILTTVFCCQPTGIYSIILSTRVDSLLAQGKTEEAKATSRNVKKWIFISLGAWVLLVAMYAIAILACYLLEVNKQGSRCLGPF